MTSRARLPGIVEFSPGVGRPGSAVTKMTPALRRRGSGARHAPPVLLAPVFPESPRMPPMPPMPPPVPQPPRFDRPAPPLRRPPRLRTAPVWRPSEDPTVRVRLAAVTARARELRDSRPWLIEAGLRLCETIVAAVIASAVMLAWARGHLAAPLVPALVAATAHARPLIVPLPTDEPAAHARPQVIIRVPHRRVR